MAVHFFLFLIRWERMLSGPKAVCVVQGSPNLSLEGQSAVEFSSNPDQTHLPVSF